MAKKRKGMTPSQAASARHEITRETMRRKQARQRARLIRKSAQEAQKKAARGVGFSMIMPFLIVAIIVLCAVLFTVGPGLVVDS